MNRKIGPVSTGAGAGGGLGYALSQVLLHFFPSLEPIEFAIILILGVGLTLVGGWLVPPQHQELWKQILNASYDDEVDIEEAEALAASINEEVEEYDAEARKNP